MEINLDFLQIPREPSTASKYLVDVLFKRIYPLINRIRKNFEADTELEELVANVQNVFTLCCCQIKKCVLNLFDIFKLENEQGTLLQESRQCTLERLSWCVTRLALVEEKLDNMSVNSENNESCEDALFSTPMYFVNWMDHTFEILSNLAGIIYKTDYKENDELYYEWKIELLDCVSVLHTSLDELLLSAMTLCKYCLPSDQIIVKTRCQVVLREAKVLLNELIEGDTPGKFIATVSSLKLPIMPTNVNVLIDVLKDVLYALETNTNTALLALVVHCFSNTLSPVDTLKEHFSDPKGCPYHDNNENSVIEDCEFVGNFDLYNERLLQIGSFAVSCSSDQERIVSLRSGLASLEALDPHLVPALMVSPRSLHAKLLTDSWRKEVQDIRDSVFLIVDPAAIAEKAKQLLHQHVRELCVQKRYDNAGVRFAIDLGGVVGSFFEAYRRHEPGVLEHHEALTPLLNDLDKGIPGPIDSCEYALSTRYTKSVLLECKVVSNLLCSNDDLTYDVKKPSNKDVSLEQLYKRLKLLYTLINRINSVLHPEYNDDQFFKSDAALEEPPITNTTYTMNPIIGNTYVSSPQKLNTITRSIFAKTTNMRTPANVYPLRKLVHQIKAQKCNELNFSVQLDEMFNLSEYDNDKSEKSVKMESVPVRSNSILYDYSRTNKASLRKMVLKRCYNLSSDKQLESKEEKSEFLVKESILDDTTSLQISEILDDMTKLLSTTKNLCRDSSKLYKPEICKTKTTGHDISISKFIRNIPADASTLEMRLDDSEVSNETGTIPSDVSTLERLRDLNRIENKLTNLKLLQKETRL